MKKSFISTLFFATLFAFNVQAQTSSIKGGVGFLHENNACAAGVCLGDDLDNSTHYFFQIVPMAFSTNSGNHGIGLRFEPFVGYSRIDQDFDSVAGNVQLDSNILQFGANFLVNYVVSNNFSIYAGPTIGGERKRLTVKMAGISKSDVSTNMFYGGEAGMDYKLNKSISVGTFASVIAHSESTYQFLNTDVNHDLGTEVRTGIKLAYHWF